MMLKSLPDWTFLAKPQGSRALWSGKEPPPYIDDEVEITLNGWEGFKGTVVGYRIDECPRDGDGGKDRYLGVHVKMSDRPVWHKKENPDRDVCLFVGREVVTVKKQFVVHVKRTLVETQDVYVKAANYERAEEIACDELDEEKWEECNWGDDRMEFEAEEEEWDPNDEA